MAGIVPVITGPTASGKSEIAFQLAERWNTEIISADSRQVYRYLDIGTAKPDAGMLEKVKHHCINIINPDENFSAGKFEKIAQGIIEPHTVKGTFPIVCGGTGLYINALVDGILEIGDDPEYRKELEEIRVARGTVALHSLLKEIDPEAAQVIPHTTHKRVVRALEVFRITGESILAHQQKQETQSGGKYIVYCLNPVREILYERINLRVDRMMEQGLIKEVESLIAQYDAGLNSLNTVGYKETIAYLRGEIDIDEMKRLIKRNSRHYAKRQMTWFRGMKNVHFIEGGLLQSAEMTAEYIYNDFNNRIRG